MLNWFNRTVSHFISLLNTHRKKWVTTIISHCLFDHAFLNTAKNLGVK